MKIRSAVIMAGLAVGLSGCTSFQRDWKRSETAVRPANPIEGRWAGRWQSEVNGHSDKLRCLLKQAGPNQYDARFQAKFYHVFTYTYTAHLAGEENAGKVRFKGQANLGRLAGGAYTYDGQADATNFFSTYNSKHDHGTFQLTRP